MKILALVTDAFGGRGGIAKFNRDLLTALCAHPDVEEVVVLPRLQFEPPGPLPPKLNYVNRAAGGKLRYLLEVIKAQGARRKAQGAERKAQSARGQAQSTKRMAPCGTDYDMILCCHMNLLPLAFLARLAGGRKPETGGRKPETGGRKPETGGRKPETGSRKEDAGPLPPDVRPPSSGLRPPIVLFIHGIDAWQPTRRWLTDWLARRIGALVSVSDFTRQRFLAWADGERSSEAASTRKTQPSRRTDFILPNCIELSRFSPGPKNLDLLKRYGLENRTVLLTVARLSSQERYKGIDEVIELLPGLTSDIPNLCYLIVGDGTDRARLVAKAKSLGLAVAEIGNRKSEIGNQKPDQTSEAGRPKPEAREQLSEARRQTSALRPLPSPESISAFNFQLSALKKPSVIFAGHIPESEKVNHYRLADAYVMPGWGEGFGIVYLEAMACGIPVVASKADASREVVGDTGLGIVVDPKNPVEIREGILAALKRPRVVVPDGLAQFSFENFQQRVHAIVEKLKC